MYIDKDDFEEWMKRIMEQFDNLNSKLNSVIRFDQQIEKDVLLDNQDLLTILKISQRTLQRMRNSGKLPFRTINKKNYYLKSDVEKYIMEHFGKGMPPKGNEETDNKNE
ncbi:hypothetical protein M2451_002956 [Dysgonomonas sp. PFB1-18]|uniref:helix-turn-helix domain-containing protein n=1 Tax=unclassified Dysgonomonas TaxID=2630389 RepID=UPI0013D3C170|nr:MULTISPECIES: helix-turn-helix domain-containing protein [unclassified Dysgonomonas]MDH6310066.1 hypothetical protein [Dysgonomonas sp. PF1-14]MDH6339975.1 hypothetical protein [Dysgonomonas sp. PF1-16]MDH6381623.1 hypothetical protein [Dysgonomonas sp. PFB1-18]MDH6398739.1 hypothetical protein [Dysgonomonas sp. PF1-23]NDV93586.1 DNA-binding protein [Dysgonomonas sp. 521]